MKKLFIILIVLALCIFSSCSDSETFSTISDVSESSVESITEIDTDYETTVDTNENTSSEPSDVITQTETETTTLIDETETTTLIDETETTSNTGTEETTNSPKERTFVTPSLEGDVYYGMRIDLYDTKTDGQHYDSFLIDSTLSLRTIVESYCPSNVEDIVDTLRWGYETNDDFFSNFYILAVYTREIDYTVSDVCYSNLVIDIESDIVYLDVLYFITQDTTHYSTEYFDFVIIPIDSFPDDFVNDNPTIILNASYTPYL
jgi:hypothetical protein